MANRFLTTLSRIGAALHESRQRSRTRAQLASLSDRQLTDIGISRSDIPWIAVHGRRR